MGKRGPAPKGRVSTTWSPDLAYSVGLITTDGSLSKSGRHINLTSKDREQINNFKKCLGIEHIKIGRKGSGYSKGKLYYQVQFGDILFYKWLVGIGLSPNKSKTLHSLKIPNKYFFHFLRGCLDGDGSIHAYWDPRWLSSYMFYSSFVSASKEFIVWLQDMSGELAGIRGHVTTSGRGIWQLKFAKGDTRKLFKKMYPNNGVTHLSRKLVKAQKIFRIDDEHNKSPGGEI